MAGILTICFAGIVVSYLIISEQVKVNSIDEIVNSQIEIYNNNNSWIYYQLDNNLRWNNPIDKDLAKIRSRLKFIQLGDKVLNKVFCDLLHL